jgi:hypothetical protein
MTQIPDPGNVPDPRPDGDEGDDTEATRPVPPPERDGQDDGGDPKPDVDADSDDDGR